MQQRLKDNSHWLSVLAIIVSLIGAGWSISQTTTTDNSTPGKTTKTVTFHIDKSGAAGTQTGTVTVPLQVQQQIAPNLEQGLKTEAPTGVSPQQTQAIQQAQTDIKSTLPGLPTSGASAGFPGCRTEFIPSYSSRHGVRPTIFTLHYTVSPNVPGWADVNSVVHLFSNPNNLASSNFVLDGEGHCAYIVPIEFKAWTQAGGNPFSVSVEVIDTGHETTYLPSPGMHELARIIEAVSARTGIPIRAGAVSSNCTPIRSGIVQHKDWGVCGGGHFDITPFPVSPVVSAVTSLAHAAQRPSKKAVWVAHRVAVHKAYLKSCHTRAERKAHAKECGALRVRARKLDVLIKRAK